MTETEENFFMELLSFGGFTPEQLNKVQQALEFTEEIKQGAKIENTKR